METGSIIFMYAPGPHVYDDKIEDLSEVEEDEESTKARRREREENTRVPVTSGLGRTRGYGRKAPYGK